MAYTCEGCGSQEATRIRRTNGVEVCDVCDYNSVRGKVGEPHGNRRMPSHYNEQLGCEVTEHNKEYVEKSRGIKLVNQPFQEYRNSGEKAVYAKAHKRKKKEQKIKAKAKRKHEFLETMRK